MTSSQSKLKSLSVLTLLVAGGLGAASASATVGAPAVGPVSKLEAATNVANLSVDLSAANVVAAAHDDDDTLVEHHHHVAAAQRADTVPTEFIV